jgi:O-antigen ligase
MSRAPALTHIEVRKSSDLVNATEVADVSANEGGKAVFWVLWLFTLAVFGRPEDIFSIVGALHLPLVLGISAALLLIFGLLTGSVRFQKPRELSIVLFLTCWFIFGVPFAYWRGGSIQLLTDVWFKTLLSFFLLTQTLTSADRIKKILWAIILSELISTVASIVLQGNGAEEVGDRLAGVNQGMFGWNFLGISLSVMLPFIAMLYVKERSKLNTLLLLATVGASMWMLILTASRGGVLGVIFSILMSWFYILRGTSRGRILAIAIIGCFVLSVFSAPGVFWSRLDTLWNSDAPSSNGDTASAEESTAGRVKLAQQAVRITLENPVFGVGVGNFPVVNGQELGPGWWLGTHNTFLQMSSEAGVPALLLLVFLFVTMLKHAKGLAAAYSGTDNELWLLGRATRISIWSFIISGFFAHLAYGYLLYYLCGIAAGLWIITQNSKQPADRKDVTTPIFANGQPAPGFGR